MDSVPIRTVSRPTCALCGSKGELLYSNLRDRFFSASGNWQLKHCVNAGCGMCWLDPVPLDEDIGLLYKSYLTHAQEDPKQIILGKLRSILYRGYTVATYVPSALLGLSRARQQILRMFLDDLEPGRLLDVGCGNGAFLHRMNQLGWNGTGVDFDLKAIENAKAKYGSTLTLLHSDLMNARFEDNSFDVVTMSHVIEHVPAPVSLLMEAKRVLKTGGRLVVTTPNVKGFGHKKFQDCWWGLDVPRHLQIFSIEALKQCARQATFDDINVTSTAANADTFMGGSFGFQQAKEKEVGGTGSRVEFNFFRGVRSLLLQYREASMLRLDSTCGDEAVLICKK